MTGKGSYAALLPAVLPSKGQASAAEVLQLTEGSLAPVACLEGGARCAHPCSTFPVWEKLEQLVTDYLQSVTLADLLRQKTT